MAVRLALALGLLLLLAALLLAALLTALNTRSASPRRASFDLAVDGVSPEVTS